MLKRPHIIFCLLFVESLYAQSVLTTLDQDERRQRENNIVLNRAAGFLGYRPTSFDSLEDSVYARNRYGRFQLVYGSLHETPEQVTAFRAGRFPIVDYQLANGAHGFTPVQGENVWLNSRAGWRPFKNLYLTGGLYYGRNSRSGDFYYHCDQVYSEFRLSSAVVSFGRKPIYWGQSDEAPLMFSDNATALDSVQLNILPVDGPWILNVFGKLKTEIFLARMNDYRENAHDYFMGYRLGAMPIDWFEMNGAFAYQFAGRGVEGGGASDTLVELLGGRVGHGSGIDDSSNITNRAMEADFRFHFKNWKYPTSLYTEQHFEDCCGFYNVFRRSYSYIWGAYSILGHNARSPRVRLEYTRIANKAYFSLTWLSGWTNDGRFMGNPSGRDSQAVHLDIEIPLSKSRMIVISPYWLQKDRRGRVDRYWIQEYYPDFQESEQRYGGTIRIKSDFYGPINFDSKGSLTSVAQKYSRTDHQTWEWGLTVGFEAGY